MPYTEPDIPNTLLNILMEAIVNRLTQVLITDAEDDAKAGLVRAGKLQDDPTSAKINLLVHPSGEQWPHTLNLSTEGPAMFAPTYEIGGGYDGRSFQGTAFFKKRFIVELKLFFDGEVYRLRAQKRANAVLARAVWALLTMQVPATVDDFGESASMIQVVDHYIHEAGGEGEFIWRGAIQVEFMTNMAPA